MPSTRPRGYSQRSRRFLSRATVSERKRKRKKEEQHSQFEICLESRPRVLQAKTRQRVKWFRFAQCQRGSLRSGQRKSSDFNVRLPSYVAALHGRLETGRASKRRSCSWLRGPRGCVPSAAALRSDCGALIIAYANSAFPSYGRVSTVWNLHDNLPAISTCSHPLW